MHKRKRADWTALFATVKQLKSISLQTAHLHPGIKLISLCLPLGRTQLLVMSVSPVKNIRDFCTAVSLNANS